LVDARKRLGLTQKEAAHRLGVSQPYLSLLERDRRPVPAARLHNFLSVYESLPSTSLPFKGSHHWGRLGNQELSSELASLGYPGFSYMQSKPNWNPAELLVAALTKPDLESRVVEALPWLALAYSNMNWGGVVDQAKVYDVQNRLGFVLTLAREVAERFARTEVAAQLSAVESSLQRSVLLHQQTLCSEHMSQAERSWLENRRTPEARRWNVLSDLSSEHLSHSIPA
jgi:transcriptional regulator with XRE-family HTH domain